MPALAELAKAKRSGALTQELSAIGADEEVLEATSLWERILRGEVAREDAMRRATRGAGKLLQHLLSLSGSDGRNPPADAHVTQILGFLQRDPRVTVIALCKRLCTLRESVVKATDEHQKFAQETLDIFARLADRLSMQELRDALEEASITLLDPDLARTLGSWRDALETLVRDNLLGSVEAACREAGLPVTAVWDPPAWSMLRQAALLGREDTIAPSAVILCDDTEACYVALGILHAAFRQEAHSFCDEINTPPANGAQALRTTIVLPEGARLSCLIRTPDMQEYARMGIALFCLRDDDVSVAEYLPWTEQLAMLGGGATNMWQFAQRDILSNLIQVHGDGERTVLLPEEATALDAAFYCLRERALWADAIEIDGKRVPFDFTPLPRGARVTVRARSERSVGQQWLRSTRTAYASSSIRTALGLNARSSKIALGRELLQAAMLDQRRGFLEEFEEEALLERVRELGHESLEDACIALAEGKAQPGQLSAQLFSAQKQHWSTDRRRITLQCMIPVSPRDMYEKLISVCERYGERLPDLRIHREEAEGTRVTIRGRLTEPERAAVVEDLRAAGAVKIRLSSPMAIALHIVLAATLVLLWAIDPVFSTMLLRSGMNETTFTLIRTWSLAAAALLVFRAVPRSLPLSRIPLGHPSLWIAGCAMSVVALLTYITLPQTTPTIYNVVMRGNALFIMAPLLLQQRSYARIAGGILAFAFSLALLRIAGGDIQGVFLCVLTLLGFATYTEASRQYQATSHIDARYPLFFACVSTIAALSTLPLLFFRQSIPPLSLTMLTLLFSLVFIGIPYWIFYTLTRSWGYTRVSRLPNIGIPLTIAADVLLLRNALSAPLLLGSLSMIVANLFLTHRAEPHGSARSPMVHTG